METLITAEGEFNHIAIDRLTAANIARRIELFGEPLSLIDIELATRDAWKRAEAEMTRFNVRNGRFLSEVIGEAARELATDGRLA